MDSVVEEAQDLETSYTGKNPHNPMFPSQSNPNAQPKTTSTLEAKPWTPSRRYNPEKLRSTKILPYLITERFLCMVNVVKTFYYARTKLADA